MAKTMAPGMKPEGSPFAAQFQEGQIMEQTFNAVPGKCYTLLSASPSGIVQLDAFATTVPMGPLPAVTLFQSSEQNSNIATIGNPTCVKVTVPQGAPFRIVVKASRGSGAAVAQLFSK